MTAENGREDAVRAALQGRREALKASLGREARRFDDMRQSQMEQAVSDHVESVDQRVASRARELEQGNINRHRAELHLVEEALHRLAEGSYGVCEECGQPISTGRLEVEPAASHCVECQTAVEAR